MDFNICQLRDMFEGETGATKQPEKISRESFTPGSIGKGNKLPDKIIPKAKRVDTQDEPVDETKDIWGVNEDTYQTVTDLRRRPKCTDTYVQVRIKSHTHLFQH